MYVMSLLVWAVTLVVDVCFAIFTFDGVFQVSCKYKHLFAFQQIVLKQW